jgi:CheY-like chemotaxis protein
MALALVVDDEEAVLRFVCDSLALDGHTALTANNGIEAVAVFRSNAGAIDVVITDMQMPVMGGAEAVARIRETRADVPVICITGYAPDSIPRGARLLKKPFAPRALLELVNRVLARTDRR